MTGKNSGICHSCRRPGHNLSECPTKRHCPSCGRGFVKWMEVDKNTVNKGRMFFCCSADCRYFKWTDECPENKTGGVYDEGESSGGASTKSSTTKEVEEELARLVQRLACISEEKDVEISLNVTIRKGKGNSPS